MNLTAHEKLEEYLQKVEGYVLLTCSRPDNKGDMQVEMSFEGDAELLLCLLEGAKSRLDSEHSDLSFA